MPQFSVADGLAGQSSYACASGIVSQHVCQPAQVTNGLLPKTCAFDTDCTAADGVTAGTCECGLGISGVAYCRPHRSDAVALKHLAVAYNGNYDEIAYYTYKNAYFNIIAHDNLLGTEEECWDDADELEVFDGLEDLLEMCSPECIATGCYEELGYN